MNKQPSSSQHHLHGFLQGEKNLLPPPSPRTSKPPKNALFQKRERLGFQDLHRPSPQSERTAPFRGTSAALETERGFLFLTGRPGGRAPAARASRSAVRAPAAGQPGRRQPRTAAGRRGPRRPSAACPSSSPPAASLRGQRPRTPGAGRVAATCLRPPPAAPGQPPSTRNRPYLSRRCGPGGGGPCSNTTTGRSASGRGGSDPRAACAELAAGRTPGSQGLRPPPAPVAPPGARWGSCPPRPSALAAPAPGTGRPRRRGLRGRARRDPRGSAERREAGRRAPRNWSRGREEEEDRKVCTGRCRLQPVLAPAGKSLWARSRSALRAREPARLLLPQGPGAALSRMAAVGSPLAVTQPADLR